MKRLLKKKGHYFADISICSLYSKAVSWQRFIQLDPDLDGYLTLTYAVKIMRYELGYSYNKASSVAALFDTDQDSCLDFDEFERFYVTVLKE